MKKIKILITLLFIAFICTGCPNKCEDCHQHITFINNSDEHINIESRRLRGVNNKDSSLCVIDLKDFVFSLPKNYLFVTWAQQEKLCVRKLNLIFTLFL